MTDPTNPQNIFYFEDVLPKTGWGLYYKFMLGMACACHFVASSTFTCIPLAIPLSTCETNDITEQILFYIFISFTIGRAIGAFSADCLSDIFGRKRLLTNSLIVNFVTAFMVAFAYNYYMIIFAVFFLGTSLEHHQVVVKVHLSEILPVKKRGYYLAFCDMFSYLGLLMVAIIVVFCRGPNYVENRIIDMRVTTWRTLFAMVGGLNLMLACASALLEESPRYFLHARKDYLAVLTLKQFYAINKSTYGNSFDVKETDLRDLIHDYGLCYNNNRNINGIFGQSFIEINKLFFKSIKLITNLPFRNATITLMGIKSVLYLLRPIEICIFLSKFVSNLNMFSGTELVFLDTLKNNTMCGSFEQNRILFYNFFLISVNILLGQFAMFCLLDCVGRKISLFFGLFLTSVSFFILFFAEDGMTKMVFCSLLMMAFTIAFTTVSVLNIESYPTCVRSTSHGFTALLPIILSVLLVRFYFVFRNWFVFIMGVLFFCVTILACFVLDLAKKPMVE